MKRTPTRPPSGELHVWQAELNSEGWLGADKLPSPERDRAAAMSRPLTQRRWVAARWALREVLGSYLGEEPVKVDLCFGERGKPMLATPGTSLRFNLSHSAELALIAVCDGREVGIDIQRLGERPAEYYADWTRREAIAKCHGTGLWAPLPEAPVAVSLLEAGPGYAAAVAIAGLDLPPMRHFKVGPDQLPLLSGPRAQ